MIAAPRTIRKPCAVKAFAPSMRSAGQRATSVKLNYKVTLETPDGKEEIECDGDTYILDAAEPEMARMVYADALNVRGAFAATQRQADMQAGEIDQSDQSFLDDDQMNNGFVLTCVAYPTSDCTITSHQEEELY